MVFTEEVQLPDAYEASDMKAPGVLLANRQLHDEGIEAYYKYTTFVADYTFKVIKWLQHLSFKNIEMVRRIRCIYSLPVAWPSATRDNREYGKLNVDEQYRSEILEKLVEFGFQDKEGAIEAFYVWREN